MQVSANGHCAFVQHALEPCFLVAVVAKLVVVVLARQVGVVGWRGVLIDCRVYVFLLVQQSLVSNMRG